MRPFLSFAMLGVLVLCAEGCLFAVPAVAEPQTYESNRTPDNVSVSRPTWHHGAGLIYGEVTIRNHNPYPITHVIIACDFFDDWGRQVGTKGVSLGRPVAPGRTRFSGIQFSVADRTTQGGACRILSADRMDVE